MALTASPGRSDASTNPFDKAQSTCRDDAGEQLPQTARIGPFGPIDAKVARPPPASAASTAEEPTTNPLRAMNAPIAGYCDSSSRSSITTSAVTSSSQLDSG